MVNVNNDCIWCGVCESVAKTIFKVDGVSKVIKQPETSEEQIASDQAEQMCPVQAISNEPIKMAA